MWPTLEGAKQKEKERERKVKNTNHIIHSPKQHANSYPRRFLKCSIIEHHIQAHNTTQQQQQQRKNQRIFEQNSNKKNLFFFIVLPILKHVSLGVQTQIALMCHCSVSNTSKCPSSLPPLLPLTQFFPYISPDPQFSKVIKMHL